MDTNKNVSTSTVLVKKKSKGRVKIPLDRKIEKKSNLQVTFSKRRKGLFSKAGELSIFTGAQIAIVVRSPAGKLFSFGSPSADAIISGFVGRTDWQIYQQAEEGRGSDDKELEMLKGDGRWDKPIETMDLEQLQNYAIDLDKLRAQFN